MEESKEAEREDMLDETLCIEDEEQDELDEEDNEEEKESEE